MCVWEQLGILQEHLEGMQGFEEICTMLLIRGQGVDPSCCLFSHTSGNAAGTWVSLPSDGGKKPSWCTSLCVESQHDRHPPVPGYKKKQNKNNKLFHNRTNKLGVRCFCRRLFYEKHLLSQQRACVFKEGINLASYTFACFLAPKPDLWTASEEPPGTMSSLHNIWLVFLWSKPARHYESNADGNMFSRVNRQAFRGEEQLLGGGLQWGSEWLLRGTIMINWWGRYKRNLRHFFL